jgi:hypothetical protein
MHVEPVDERDSSWEERRPRFRVYLFAGPGPGFSTETYDLTDVDIQEATAWAATEAGPDRRFSIALVWDNDHDGSSARGLIWLVGHDLNEWRG